MTQTPTDGTTTATETTQLPVSLMDLPIIQLDDLAGLEYVYAELANGTYGRLSLRNISNYDRTFPIATGWDCGVLPNSAQRNPIPLPSGGVLPFYKAFIFLRPGEKLYVKYLSTSNSVGYVGPTTLTSTISMRNRGNNNIVVTEPLSVTNYSGQFTGAGYFHELCRNTSQTASVQVIVQGEIYNSNPSGSVAYIYNMFASGELMIRRDTLP